MNSDYGDSYWYDEGSWEYTDDEGEEHTDLEFEEEIRIALEMLEGDGSEDAFYEDNHHVVEEYEEPTVFSRVRDWWEGF